MDLDEAIDSFIFHLKVERGLSKNTVDAYSRDLRQFTQYCGDRRSKPSNKESSENVAPPPIEAASIDALEISGFMSEMLDAGNKTRTVARKLSSIRGLFTHLRRIEVLKVNPASKVDAPK